MGLDVWFREDLEQTIMAVDQASAMTAVAIDNVSQPELVRAWRQGFRAALVTLAVAFGIDDGKGGDSGGQRRLDDR